MAYKKFWLGMLVMVLAFGMTVIGCDTGGGGESNRNPVVTQPTPLQRAINWANEDARRWTAANNNPFLTDLPFSGIVPGTNNPWSVDDVIQGERTFIQFVEDALTEAWDTTYRYNPSAWNAARWKEIIGNAFTGVNSYFGTDERPLIIS